MIGKDTWLYFILDANNRSLYVDSNGAVQRSSLPAPLKQHPSGWKEIQISFGTNYKYWNLQRSYTVPMFFVGDGADICRWAVYQGKGYEEELYIVILKLDEDSGIHMLEYSGRLDFGKHQDEPRKGITVNSIEGGVLTELITGDGVDQEIPLDPVYTPGTKSINFDGVNLYDRVRYSLINLNVPKPTDFDHRTTAYTLPVVYVSNEGDSVGIIWGSQRYEEVSSSSAFTNSSIYPYTSSSGNYLFSSAIALSVHITGTIRFYINQAGGALSVHIGFHTSTNTGTGGNGYPILGGTLGTGGAYIVYNSPQEVLINVDIVIPLLADEKLFLIAIINSNSISAQSIDWFTTDLFLEYQSKVPPTTAYGLPILETGQQIISRLTEGKYTMDSVYFRANKDIVFTSTNALQNYAFQHYYGSIEFIESGGLYQIKIQGTLKTLPNGNQIVITGAAAQNGVYTIVNVSGLVSGFTTVTVEEPVVDGVESGVISSVPALKMSWQDYFNDVDCLTDGGIGMKIRNNVVWIEPKPSLYDDDVQIYDIGEIANLKIRYAYDLLCNTGTFGYRSQDYRQRNGIYEPNTTTVFKFPVDTVKKDFTRVLKSRGDSYGIEFIRYNAYRQPTTDSTGDNQPFVVNTMPSNNDTTTPVIFFNNGTFLIDDDLPIFPGDVITFSGSVTNNVTVTVTAVAQLSFSLQAVAITGATLTNEGPVTVSVTFVLSATVKPKRVAYDSISGVLDNTVYNIEDMTPHRLMLKQGPTLKSMMVQFQGESIVFRSADKNSSLSTTLAGVTISERQDEVISNLPGDILFLPLVADFTTVVPLSFAQVMQNIGTGYIRGTFYGQPVYFLPIGKMDAKPAVNAAQNWSLLLAPMNSLNAVHDLSLEGVFTIDNMGNSIFTSDLNPLHFNRYNYQLPAKYQHKEMYDDHFQNRTEDFLSQPYYLQKFQKTENIAVQCVTNGLSTPNVEVYNGEGILVSSTPMVVTAVAAVQFPNVLWNYSIPTSGLDDGIYFVVISAGGVPMRISEYIHVAESHPKTILWEYSHTTNKANTYWTDFPAKIRVEATMLPWKPDSEFQSYTDELADFEVLDGIPSLKRTLVIGNTYGVPDWMAMKMNKILLLNRVYGDGVRYSRTPDSKFVAKEIQGHPMNIYRVDIAKATNQHGLATDETGTTLDNVVGYTLDAQAFGTATPGDVISIDIPIEP